MKEHSEHISGSPATHTFSRSPREVGGQQGADERQKSKSDENICPDSASVTTTPKRKSCIQITPGLHTQKRSRSSAKIVITLSVLSISKRWLTEARLACASFVMESNYSSGAMSKPLGWQSGQAIFTMETGPSPHKWLPGEDHRRTFSCSVTLALQ